METLRKKFFLAVNTGLTQDSLPTQDFLDFYFDRSSEELYCTIVGNVVLPNGYGTNNSTPIINGDRIWSKLAQGIKNRGSKAGIQLSTTWSGYIGQQKFINKNNHLLQYKEYSNSFSRDFIEQEFLNLYEGTKLAINHGFDHIQLHAAHGYLFSLLIDPLFCVYYELAIHNIISWLNLLKNDKIESSIRVSLITGSNSIDTIRDLDKFLKSCRPDFYDLSDGFYNINKRLIYPSVSNIKARINRQIALATKYPAQKFISSGLSYGCQSDLDKSLPHNLHIGICRNLIANPNYLSNPTFGCENCSKCHYYSRGESYLSCSMWHKR